jgi:hypothetical protein
MACDSTTLADAAKCFNCLNPDDLDAIYTQLLCQSADLVNFAVTPPDFPLLQGWWKADSLVLADNTPIGAGAGTDWTDSSGNSRTLVQAVAGSRPVFRTNQFGSMPGITLSGTQFLTLANTITIPVNGLFTVIGVYKQTAANDGMLAGHDVDNIQFRINRVNANRFGFFAGGFDIQSEVLTSAQTDTIMGTWRRAFPGDLMFRDNKNAKAPVLGTDGGALTINRMFTTSFGGTFAGTFAEICIYSGRIADVDLNALYDTYFKARWGLP